MELTCTFAAHLPQLSKFDQACYNAASDTVLVWLRQTQSCGNKTSHPAQFQDAAGENRGWFLATDPHDPTSRNLITVVQQTVCWLLIYRRAASRGTVSKMIGEQILVTHPSAPCGEILLYIGAARSETYLLEARAVTDVEMSSTCGSVP
ncbi:hypothetical protein T4D_12289 [Trichinella pseudospiralis]|uniref:Uncharacterized protein n=1 Tax=Trichinella pseudospiralis TaxID=6337 RepID=A0A0V1FDL0_TRIPS|nr:hypothetical protein T4D_12289 [Trichinella pseudospiralis]